MTGLSCKEQRSLRYVLSNFNLILFYRNQIIMIRGLSMINTVIIRYISKNKQNKHKDNILTNLGTA